MRLSSALTALILTTEACSAPQPAPARCLPSLFNNSGTSIDFKQAIQDYEWQKDPECDREVAGILADTAFNSARVEVFRCEREAEAADSNYEIGSGKCQSTISEAQWSILPAKMPASLRTEVQTKANEALQRRIQDFAGTSKWHKAKKKELKEKAPL